MLFLAIFVQKWIIFHKIIFQLSQNILHLPWQKEMVLHRWTQNIFQLPWEKEQALHQCIFQAPQAPTEALLVWDGGRGRGFQRVSFNIRVFRSSAQTSIDLKTTLLAYFGVHSSSVKRQSSCAKHAKVSKSETVSWYIFFIYSILHHMQVFCAPLGGCSPQLNYLLTHSGVNNVKCE